MNHIQPIKQNSSDITYIYRQVIRVSSQPMHLTRLQYLSYPVLYLFILLSFFFFNATATPEIYTLSLHHALPISASSAHSLALRANGTVIGWGNNAYGQRSEEHTSELQSLAYLVCRLLLEKKKKKQK